MSTVDLLSDARQTVCTSSKKPRCGSNGRSTRVALAVLSGDFGRIRIGVFDSSLCSWSFPPRPYTTWVKYLCPDTLRISCIAGTL